MPATIGQARDQICGAVKTAVDARNVGLASNLQLVLLWDDVADGPRPPEPPTPWARVTVVHSKGGLPSLSGGLGGKTRRTRKGFTVTQLFTVGGAGNVVADEITPIILAAFEGKTTSGGIFFRQGRAVEIGQSGGWHQTNITVEFEYDEIS